MSASSSMALTDHVDVEVNDDRVEFVLRDTERVK